jgi:hypothetical protein
MSENKPMNPSPTPPQTPSGYWDRLFARLEFLMSKKTMRHRVRH